MIVLVWKGEVVVQAETTQDGAYEYIVLEDGTVEIMKYRNNKPEEVVPGEIDGKPVTRIGDEAFYGCNSLTSIKTYARRGQYGIYGGLYRLGYRAFAGCTNLKEIEIRTTGNPNGDSWIGEEVFKDCSDDLIIYCTEGTFIHDYVIANNHNYRLTDMSGGELVTSVTYSPDSAELKVGDTITLSVTVLPEDAGNKAVTFSSSDENVATIDSFGVVTAKGVGQTTITVTSCENSGIQAIGVIFVVADDGSGDGTNGGVSGGTGDGSGDGTTGGVTDGSGDGSTGGVTDGNTGGTAGGNGTADKNRCLKQAANGNYYMYTDGAIDRSYTGLFHDETYGWWLINGGAVNFGYTGLYCDANYGWWLINGRAVNFGYTGNVNHEGSSYYVVNGQLV